MPIADIRHYVDLSQQGAETIAECLRILEVHRASIDQNITQLRGHLDLISSNNIFTHYDLEHRYSQAIEYTRRAIEFEPWSESLHRRKMILLAQSKQPNAALRQ